MLRMVMGITDEVRFPCGDGLVEDVLGEQEPFKAVVQIRHASQRFIIFSCKTFHVRVALALLWRYPVLDVDLSS